MSDNFKYCRPLTVGELIAALKTYPEDMRIALSCDSEGNNYSYMPNKHFICTPVYMPLNGWADNPINCIYPNYEDRCEAIVLFPAR